MNYVPHYYKDFRCIADKCKDSCCIGWEIDIDPDTLEMYMSMNGELGEMLRSNITVADDGSDCFRLTENERCPFLNDDNLCRLILHGGDDMLCHICRMHPRFVNEYGGRCETGIGMCCEEAARMILTDDKPFLLICEDDEKTPEHPSLAPLLQLRQKLIDITESGIAPDEMLRQLLEMSAAAENIQLSPLPSHRDNIKLIQALEPLNELWQTTASKLSDSCGYILDEKYQNEYAALLKYYIFRYLIKAYDEGEIFLKTALAVFSALAVSCIMTSSGMSFIDSACLWSKETEYSNENTEMIYNYIYERFIADVI